jgi:hypothetical protein
MDEKKEMVRKGWTLLDTLKKFENASPEAKKLLWDNSRVRSELAKGNK